MSAFVSSVVLICASLLTASVIKLIAPFGDCEKILKRIISLFVLISIATCAISVKNNLNIRYDSSFEKSTVENITDAKILKTTADYISDYIVGILENDGIKETQAEVILSADENSVINISEVIIYISREQMNTKAKVEEIIENNFLLTPKVIVKEQ